MLESFVSSFQSALQNVTGQETTAILDRAMSSHVSCQSDYSNNMVHQANSMMNRD